MESSMASLVIDAAPAYVQAALRALYKDEEVHRCGAQLAVAHEDEEVYVATAYDRSGEELSHLRRFIRCGSRASRLYAVAHREAGALGTASDLSEKGGCVVLKPSACSQGDCASTIELFRREKDDVFARTLGEILGAGGDVERHLRRRGVVEATGATKMLERALRRHTTDCVEMEQAVEAACAALRSTVVESDAWYPVPDPALDLMRCLVDVDGGAHWPVLLAASNSSAFAEPVGFALSLLLEHCALPLTARDALALDAAALAYRVGSAEDAQALRAQLMRGEQAASTDAEADAAARDLLSVADALVASIVHAHYDTPVVDAEALKRLATPSIRRAAAHADDILVMAVRRGCERFGTIPPWLILGELAVAALAYVEAPPKGTTDRERKTLHGVAVRLVAGLTKTLGCKAAKLVQVPKEALAIIAKPWDKPTFLEDERCRYKSLALAAHGTIINPITGQELDVMRQCVGLHVEARDRRLADDVAFEDALSAFAETVALRSRVYVHDGVRDRAGDVVRVNGDGTYDVKPLEENAKTLRDVGRASLAAEPLLVIGDPAGGKTTFAKQLLTYNMRCEAAYLIPVLVRVCDVVRLLQSDPPDAHEPLVWAYLRRSSGETTWRFYEQARAEKRLLLLLDGFDEGGVLGDRLEQEIEGYARHPLVVTSRDMKCLRGTIFQKFRRVRVLQLDQKQIEEIARQRLPGESERASFLEKLRVNASLSRMARNPLLLSVTLTVFEESVESMGDGSLTRGRVYEIALTAMLTRLDGLDASLARRLFRRVAWVAHSFERGRGTRDFGDALAVSAAAALGDDADVAQEAWRTIADAAQRGRLPLISWFTERGRDRYRFAHLTFQEFLAAEHAVRAFENDADHAGVAARFAALATHPSGRPGALFERGWWQQVIQMFGDLAPDAYRRAVAEALLGGAQSVDLDSCVGDRNVATLVALLPPGRALETLKITDGGVGRTGASQLSPGIAAVGARLRVLDLAGNLLDGPAAVLLCSALARSPLQILDLASNCLCVGENKRDGFDQETYHSRKRGGSAQSKLYLDYMHAAWVPDLRGVEACVELARSTTTLRYLDLRSNGLTEKAGNLLASLFDDAVHVREVCGVDAKRLRTGRCVVLAPAGELDDEEEEQRVFNTGDRVEARFQGGRRFYPAVVVRAHNDAHVDLAYVDLEDRVVRREERVPRRMVRLATTGPPRRLEAGGCVVLAAALERAGPAAKGALKELRLARQALAFDLDSWDAPSCLDSKSHATGINAEPVKRLIAALAAFPRVEIVDCRDSMDPGADVGEALASAAMRHNWTTLGLGAALLDVRSIRTQEESLRVRGALRDGGVGAVARLSENVTELRVSTAGVSSAGLERLVAKAKHTSIATINGLDVQRFRAEGPTLLTLDFSDASLDRATARMVLQLLENCASLETLNLTNSELMPCAHPHPMTPEVFGSGHLCNACASHHGLAVDLNLACRVCDHDTCGAAWRSRDVVDDLADALAKLGGHLKHLSLRNCCFGMMDGPIAKKPFEHLGQVLGEAMVTLETIDLSENDWSAPRLTRWCAESLIDDASEDPQPTYDDEGDAADARWHRRARQWARAVDAEASSSGADDNDDDAVNRAYSRQRIPLAAGFPALARGLARAPALVMCRVDGPWALDLTKVRTAVGKRLEAEDCFVGPGSKDYKAIHAGAQSCTDPRVAQIYPLARLANVRLFTEAFQVLATSPTYPRHVICRLHALPPLCHEAGQQCLLDLFDSLDVLEVGSLDLELKALRDGASATLDVSVERLERRWPPLEGESEGVTAARRERSALEGSKCCGRLVAAAIAAAARIVEVDCRGVALGEAAADVAAAARRHVALRRLNGVSTDAPPTPRLCFARRRIGDAGALALGRDLERSRHALESLDLRDCSLGPAGVAAVLHGLGRRRSGDPPRRDINPRLLNLERNDVGDVGMHALARHLRDDARLETLQLRGCQLPRSTTRAMAEFGLAFEANVGLVVLDLRGARTPAQLARGLRRTVEKRPTVAPQPEVWTTLLLCLNRRGLRCDEDALNVVFGFARRRRQLLLNDEAEALADLFPLRSAEARNLVDRLDAGEFDHDDDDDLSEINTLLSRLDERDQRSVTRAYWVLRAREHPPEDFDAFANEGPPPDDSPSESSSSDEEEDGDAGMD